MFGSGASSLRDILIERASVHPDRIAYDDGVERVTFGGLADRAAARAGQLAAAGICQGDRVALVLSPGLVFAEVFWALQLLGAASAAFDPSARVEAIRRRVGVVRPAWVLTDDDVRAAPVGAPSFDPPEIRDGDLAFLQPTSGTSGKPRGAMIEQRQILAMMRGIHHHVTADDVMINWVPPWHDLGLVRFIIGTVYYGAICHIVSPAVATIPEWLRRASEHGGTVTAAPDFCYRLAARLVDPATVNLSTLRFTSNGGEPVRRSSIEAFEERFDVPGRVLPAYGLAEATVGVTSHLPGDEIPVDERGNVSCGPVIDGLELVAGDDPDAPAEIRVRGGSVFAGYFDAPDETAAIVRDGWLHTGDSGYVDEQGRLFVLGRRSTLIKRGGATIAPRELEEAAQRVPGLRVVAAVAVPGADEGDDVVTVMAEADVETPEDESALVSSISREVVHSLGFAPGRVVVVPRGAIPRTHNGKVRHAHLREMLAEQPLAS